MKKQERFFLVITSGVNVEVNDLDLIRRAVCNAGLLVWIPIVEDWKGKMDTILCIAKVLDCSDLHVFCGAPKKLALRFLSEEWKYSKGKKTINLVVMNKDFVVENSDAMDLIRRFSSAASPFDRISEKRILDKVKWPKIVATQIGEPEINFWVIIISTFLVACFHTYIFLELVQNFTML